MIHYRNRVMAELAHQLKLSPTRFRLRQLDGVERLADMIEPDKSYPYEFICFHITGYHPRQTNSGGTLLGSHLILDLVELAEDLSSNPVISTNILSDRVWTSEQLARRLHISPKTVCRWRKRGLMGRKLRFQDNQVRLAFSDRCVRRFVCRNIETVRRGSTFRHLSEEDRAGIIERARVLIHEQSMGYLEAAHLIAEETGRAVETIRYTLRRHDRIDPDHALTLTETSSPVVHQEFQELYAAYVGGANHEQLASRYNMTVAEVKRTLCEIRIRRLLAQPLRFVYSHEFDSPDADERILVGVPEGEAEAAVEWPAAFSGEPDGLPPYMQELCRTPVLTGEQERLLFRKYNYLKFKADRLCKRIDPAQVTEEQLSAVEAIMADVDEVQGRITRANLRLVVSIARRHLHSGADFMDVISDGNMSLLRAMDRFDYTRGFKFSTYASWVIMRSYARTIPEAQIVAKRFANGNDELLDVAPDPREAKPAPALEEPTRKVIERCLDQLPEREREVVKLHFGIGSGDGRVATLDQIGRKFGLTKERIRQIELRAIKHLREIFDEEGVTAEFDTG